MGDPIAFLDEFDLVYGARRDLEAVPRLQSTITAALTAANIPALPIPSAPAPPHKALQLSLEKPRVAPSTDLATQFSQLAVVCWRH